MDAVALYMWNQGATKRFSQASSWVDQQTWRFWGSVGDFETAQFRGGGTPLDFQAFWQTGRMLNSLGIDETTIFWSLGNQRLKVPILCCSEPQFGHSQFLGLVFWLKFQLYLVKAPELLNSSVDFLTLWELIAEGLLIADIHLACI